MESSSVLYPWLALFVAVIATMMVRSLGPLLGRWSFSKKINEETLSRLCPLVILFCLVFKELSSELSAIGFYPLGIKALAVLVVVGLHLWKRNLFISIMGGTFIYAILLKLIS